MTGGKHKMSLERRWARIKQQINGNSPDQTGMDLDTREESYSESWRWCTGFRHKDWLEHTKKERVQWKS